LSRLEGDNRNKTLSFWINDSFFKSINKVTAKVNGNLTKLAGFRINNTIVDKKISHPGCAMPRRSV